MLYVIAGIAVIAVLFFSYRANELFCVSVRNGRALLVRGRIPPALLSDFNDVISAPPVARGTIRGYRDQTHARLDISGFKDEGQEQRLRNVFHIYPMSNLRAAPGAKDRTIGQILGIVWLAWLLDRSLGR